MSESHAQRDSHQRDIVEPTSTPSDPPHRNEKEVLELEELRLKIRELKRPFWLSSGVVTSLLIAAITGVTGYFTGFFQVQLDKIKFETEKQTFINEQVALQAKQLKQARDSLDSDLRKLTGQVSTLEAKEKELIAKNQTLHVQYEDAIAPRLNVDVTNYFTAPDEGHNKFAITLHNSGKGPVKVLPFDIFVDRKFVASATAREPWIEVLRALNINHGWVHIWYAGSDPKLLENLAPEARHEILGIFNDQVSRRRVMELSEAAERLGIIFCYCSSKKCAAVRFGELPDSVKSCRTGIRLNEIRW